MESKEAKICSKCRQEKALSEFGKCAANPDGLQYYCKECQSEYWKTRKKKRNTSNTEQVLHQVFFNPELAKFQPKDLIAELRARGYSGELRFTQKITV